VSTRLVFEELDAALTQGNGYLHSFVPEYEVFRPRQEVRNDPEIPERFIGVFNSVAHKFAFLYANSQLREYGLGPRGR